MASLKSFIPTLANPLGMTPAALYERQRALVRAGLLEAKPGRGRGSGVSVTPQSVAMMLIAILATDSLSETEAQTKIVATLKNTKGRCSLTGKKTLAAALTAILASEDTIKRAKWIYVHRGPKPRAGIAYSPRGIERVVSVAVEVLSEGRTDWPVESEFGFVRRQSAFNVRAGLGLVPLHTILKEINK